MLLQKNTLGLVAVWLCLSLLPGWLTAEEALDNNGPEEPAAPLNPANYDLEQATQSEDQGVIDELSFAGQSMQISGYQYPVSPTVQVEIAGSYGAFTMLTEGMRIRFTYLQFDDGNKLITEIVEDPTAEEF